MADKNSSISREKAVKRIASPEHLTEYLRVTNPGIWLILIAVILLMTGALAWAAVGQLETRTEVKVIIENHTANVVPLETQELKTGMPLRVAGQESEIIGTDVDEYGRTLGIAVVSLPDGTYDGIVVVETIHPIEFLLTSK